MNKIHRVCTTSREWKLVKKIFSHLTNFWKSSLMYLFACDFKLYFVAEYKIEELYHTQHNSCIPISSVFYMMMIHKLVNSKELRDLRFVFFYNNDFWKGECFPRSIVITKFDCTKYLHFMYCTRDVHIRTLCAVWFKINTENITEMRACVSNMILKHMHIYNFDHTLYPM